MILGSTEQLADETTARQAIATLRLDLNYGEAWLKTRSTAVSELAAHYRERELEPDTIWKTHSTKVTYEGYLNKWILPRWGKYPLVRSDASKAKSPEQCHSSSARVHYRLLAEKRTTCSFSVPTQTRLV
jgi:hypothetical protein